MVILGNLIKIVNEKIFLSNLFRFLHLSQSDSIEWNPFKFYFFVLTSLKFCFGWIFFFIQNLFVEILVCGKSLSKPFKWKISNVLHDTFSCSNFLFPIRFSANICKMISLMLFSAFCNLSSNFCKIKNNPLTLFRNQLESEKNFIRNIHSLNLSAN